jgi:hypothetical protein
MSSFSISQKLKFIILYSISMAMLEAAVVIYLRIIFFPSHFNLPAHSPPQLIMGAELARELATILMLICIGYFAGNNKASRFAWFLISFGIWDIFYYVFLYVFLAWPDSILGWDILFLIPVPWYGPVLSPILVSLAMIFFATAILHAQTKSFAIRTNRMERLLMLSGCAIILFTYTYDFILFISRINVSLKFAFTMFMPEHYNWPLFGIGLGLIITAICLYLRRIQKTDDERMKAMY